ncbi:MAG: TolC family protein [Bryobacteraceae bacterium]|nr:TolC family protein [Bryobacteraceae bacterium]
MWRVFGVLLLLLVMLLADPRPASAQAKEAELRLGDLVAEAVRNNPELQAAQKRVEAARQKPRQEGALPDPMVSVGYASAGSPIPGSGIGREPTANTGVMVTQELPYPGKRRLMAARAGKEADAELQSYLTVERVVISRVKQAFHKLNHAYENVEVMKRSQDLLMKFVQLAEIRYAAGKAMQQDIFRAQTQFALMETRIVKMQQDLAMAEAEINALVHRPIDARLARPAHLSPKQLDATLAELTAEAEASSPQIAREQKMTEARQLGVSLARKNYKPDFAVSGGYFYMGSMPDMYQFRLDIKLPAWRSKNDAALTEQVQSLEQSRRTYQAMAHETRWKVNEQYIIAQTSWRLLQLFSDSVMPQTELATASSMASYESGAIDSLQVLMNVMTRVEQEERYHEAMLNYFMALVRLEEITGMELLSQ